MAFHQFKPEKKDIIFGIHPIMEAIEAGKEIERILIQKELSNIQLKELLGLAATRKIPYQKVPTEKLDGITRKNHQGAICFLSAITYSSLDHILQEAFEKGKAPIILVLDRITDVRNFGAISRTAECCGVDAIVVPSRGSAQINADAVKTSAGALHHIPVCREENLKSTLNYLKECGLQLVACTEKGTQTISRFDFTTPVALLMGSEEDGISEEYLKLSDAILKIPTTGKVNSLNVSVAAGMALYEIIRQRNSI
ncbi:MAG: 23S rRNA (guanosine(2251)-2'-O)-methyltransferase RlmB [Cytophagales bacterium]|nr:MAG: 23S rRNA (guanosine(2251)-2'-O)-methyltransferase RlmB [Cytophagales bacterium]